MVNILCDTIPPLYRWELNESSVEQDLLGTNHNSSNSGGESWKHILDPLGRVQQMMLNNRNLHKSLILTWKNTEKWYKEPVGNWEWQNVYA